MAGGLPGLLPESTHTRTDRPLMHLAALRMAPLLGTGPREGTDRELTDHTPALADPLLAPMGRTGLVSVVCLMDNTPGRWTICTLGCLRLVSHSRRAVCRCLDTYLEVLCHPAWAAAKVGMAGVVDPVDLPRTMGTTIGIRGRARAKARL